MALTLSQATTAGEIAAQITALQAALFAAQTALAGGMFITAHGLSLADAEGKKKTTVNSGYPLGTADSVVILNALIATYLNSINALTAQLAGM